MLIRREAVFLKLESTYKVEVAPDLTDAIFCDKVKWSNEAKMLDRSGPKETLGKRQQVFGGRIASISFTAELKGSGAAGTPPEIDSALIACGMKKTVVASTSVLYQPDTTDIPSCTIYYFQDGKLKKLLGARGQISFEASSQNFGKANFVFTGHATLETDTAFVVPTYDNLTPPQFINAQFQLATVWLELSKFTIDLGNEISKPLSVNSQTGIGEIRINTRDVKGSMDPEMVLNSVSDFYSKLHLGTVGALTTGTVGITAGNRWKFDAPKAYIRGISEGERESIRITDIELGFAENNGDDEIGLTFT